MTLPGFPSAEGRLRSALRRLPHAAVELGLAPGVLGHRWLSTVALDELRADPDRWHTLAPERTESHALPVGVTHADALSDDAGWWGYSQRDVPTRRSGETALLELENARLLPATDPVRDEFHPALLDARRRVVPLPQISLRGFHRPLVGRRDALRIDEATWIAERVYDNHSHWLTAHLPKVLLAREHGLLSSLVLPDKRTATMRTSLELLGIDLDAIASVPVDRPIDFRRLRLFVTDRFDPRLLCRVRTAFERVVDDAGDGGSGSGGRLWISRARSRGRRLLEEEALLPRLRAAGFERVFLEELDFPAQVALMRSARVLVAPHGAGLTNMLFCKPGTDIVEIADPLYPNPNFYAMAAGLGLRYRLVEATAVGEGHRLTRDLSVKPEAIDAVFDELRQAML